MTLPPWPIHIRISNSNVDITDNPPEDAVTEGMDAASPNPFLPSLLMMVEGGNEPQGKKKKGKAKKEEKKPEKEDKGGDGKKKGKKKDKGPEKRAKEYLLTAMSQSLDLTSPAGAMAGPRHLRSFTLTAFGAEPYSPPL